MDSAPQYISKVLAAAFERTGAYAQGLIITKSLDTPEIAKANIMLQGFTGEGLRLLPSGKTRGSRGVRDILSLIKARQKIACSSLYRQEILTVATQPRGPAERCRVTLSMIEGKTGNKRKAYKGLRCVHSLPWSSS